MVSESKRTGGFDGRMIWLIARSPIFSANHISILFYITPPSYFKARHHPWTKWLFVSRVFSVIALQPDYPLAVECCSFFLQTQYIHTLSNHTCSTSGVLVLRFWIHSCIFLELLLSTSKETSLSWYLKVIR